jgi:hypothetical protein
MARLSAFGTSILPVAKWRKWLLLSLGEYAVYLLTRGLLYGSIALQLHRQPPARMSCFRTADKPVYRVVCVSFVSTRSRPANADLHHSSSAVPRLSFCTTTPLPNPAICGSSLLSPEDREPSQSSSDVAKCCLTSPVPDH